MELQFKNEMWVVSFEKAAIKEKVLGDVSNNDIFKVRYRQSLSGTFNLRRRTARDAFSYLLGYRKLV